MCCPAWQLVVVAFYQLLIKDYYYYIIIIIKIPLIIVAPFSRTKIVKSKSVKIYSKLCFLVNFLCR